MPVVLRVDSAANASFTFDCRGRKRKKKIKIKEEEEEEEEKRRGGGREGGIEEKNEDWGRNLLNFLLFLFFFV